MICEPISFNILGESVLTVALVPTGMKTGVEISPWGVVIKPVLALPDFANILNSIGSLPEPYSNSLPSVHGSTCFC